MNCQSDHVVINIPYAYEANLTIHYVLHVCFYPKPSTTGVAFILAVPRIPATPGTVSWDKPFGLASNKRDIADL